MKFMTGTYGHRPNGGAYPIVRELAKLNTSSEKWERECPGKRLRIDASYQDYVAQLGLSTMEYDHYKHSNPTPVDHGPTDRVNANLYTNYIISSREWYETMPAMQHLRQTEQSFTEADIQAEYAGPDRIAHIRRSGYEKLSNCQRFYQTSDDLTIPVRPINPDGYRYYTQSNEDEEMMWKQMKSMKRSADQMTPTPCTDAMIDEHVATRAAQVARTENERSRSRGPHQ